MAISRPEPTPHAQGQVVPDLLCLWLEYIDAPPETLQLIRERDRFGRQKYGQPLMTDDGRDTIEDARQELGDLIQYVFKARLRGQDVEPIRCHLPVLNQLLSRSPGLSDPSPPAL